jgi:hypothetical protein
MKLNDAEITNKISYQWRFLFRNLNLQKIRWPTKTKQLQLQNTNKRTIRFKI